MEKNTIFKFSRGSFFGGTLEYTITKDNDTYLLDSFGFGKEEFMLLPSDLQLSEAEVQTIIDTVKPAFRWKKEYELEDVAVMDGYNWHLTICWHDLKIDSSGYAAKPYNYRKVVRALQNAIEDICQKYDPVNYDEKGREARIRL